MDEQRTTVTVKAVLDEQYRKKDGTNFIRLRITYKRKIKYLKTQILVTDQDLKTVLKVDPKTGKTKECKEVKQRTAALDQMQKLEVRMREKLAEIDPLDLDKMTVDEVAEYLQGKSTDGPARFRLDFFEFSDEVIEAKQGHPKKFYRSAVNSFKTFLGKEKMDISELSSSLLRDYEQWLRDKYGDNARSLSAYTNCLSYIHGQACEKYNNEETGKIVINNPFRYYKTPKQRPGKHRSVDKKLIQKMINMRGELDGRERFGVDVFLISFALMGMNSPDLFTCARPNKQGVIVYNRTKTRDRRNDEAELHVKLEDHTKDLIGEYRAQNSDRAFDFYRRYSCYENLTKAVNEGLKQFVQRIKYKGKLTLYSARHSWASIAYAIGVDKSVINDCLCHVDKDMKVTDIYINKDWRVLWKANEKVMKQFSWA